MDLSKMKGNLGLKSSALAPTACKLSSQFLVLDHMSNHYTKIARAKSAIDSRPPKSLMASQKICCTNIERINISIEVGGHLPEGQGTNSLHTSQIFKIDVHATLKSWNKTKVKMWTANQDFQPEFIVSEQMRVRDRMNRNRFLGSPQPRLHSSVSGTVLSDYEDVLKDEPEDEEEKLVHSIMRSTLLEKSRSSNNATYSAGLHMDPYQQERMSTNIHETSPYGPVIYEHPASVHSVRSGLSLTSSPSRVALATSLLVKRTCIGDVLEKRPHLFTEPERPFTPRTLKKKTESRLKNSKCYNPPHNKSVKKEYCDVITDKNSQKDTVQNYSKDIKILEKGRIQNKKQQSKFQSPQQQNNTPQKVREHSENDLEATSGASKLSSSMLMDISVRSRDEAHNQETVNGVPPLAITMDKDHMNWLQEQASKAEVRARSSGRLKSSLHPDEELQSASRYHSRESRVQTDVKMEKQRKDEEQKYLAFAKEVTDDVLSRGISADSVLDKVFENHIVRRKDDLDEDRMRKVISDLRKNLGVKESFTRGQDSASLSDYNYNKSRRVHITDTRSRGSHQVNSDPDVNSTLESVDTFKFGQTGDVLSTVNSVASLDKKETEKRLEDESEMVFSQTLREYQLRLTDKEEVDESHREAGHNGMKEDTMKHLYGKQKPAVSERRMARQGKFRSDVSSVEQMPSTDKSPATSLQDSHATNDEDTSVGSSVLSQRPVARPRIKARQGSQERTKAVRDEEVIPQEHQDNVHSTTAGGLEKHNSQTAGQADTTDSDTEQPGHTGEPATEQPGHTGEPATEQPGHTGKPATEQPGHTGKPATGTAKLETDQQQAEEEDEYEDDYEEIIESENDSDDDF